MALYVANLTKQEFNLIYWVENSKKPVVTKIKPGQQESVYPQGNRVDHERIVDQHRMYGLIPVSEMDRHREFVGQLYQYDTPIPLDRLYTGMTKNEDALVQQALERRKEAAVSSDDLMKRAAQETDAHLGNFEVEIQEVEQKGVEATVHEVISVGDDAPQERRGRGRPRRN
ncbi:hypothetical protein [Paraburkholderia dilworthii]|uniref:hypothetical protein n=1 Tax=Paraburkholderia dilworthii TaxID=948106 RepID=UPI0004298676|nr:hypothetical protein [Paraburkholderia dilworthii]